MMERRAFLGTLGLLAVPPTSFAWAQPAPRVYRLGFLGSAQSAQADALLGTLQGRLQELGYAEGRNLVLERRLTQGQNE